MRRIIELTPSTKHFEWQITEGGDLEFYAGQFVSVEVPHDDGLEARPYSIASAPRDGKSFDLCLNRVESGYVSNFLCDLEPGAVIDLNGPHGSFVVSSPIDQDVVFVATGTGIAPIRGMLAALLGSAEPPKHDVWLLFGVRYADTILYRAEFENWVRENSRFRFIPTLSRPPAGWRGETGYVQAHLRRMFAGHKDFKAYVCGLKAMVDEVRFVLKQDFGLDRKQIRFEKYD